MLDIIRQFNWVDIFIEIVLFRICYIAIKGGLLIEFFKLLGALIALYLSLHYHSNISSLILQQFHLPEEKLQAGLINFVILVLLLVLGYFAIFLLRALFYRFMSMETSPNLNKWGGLVLGIFRSLIVCGLIVFTLVISGNGYLKRSVGSSYFGKRLFNLAPYTYGWLWNNVTSKFIKGEKINRAALQAGERILE